jgi:hypothetical protein
MTPEIRKMQRLAQRVRDLNAEFKAAIAQAQSTCRHEDVVEAPSHDGLAFFFNPFRVCRTCGLREEGWMYSTLGEPAARVSREDAQRIAHKVVYAP